VNDDAKQVELAAVVREIQERVRARYPVNSAGSCQIPLADLMPVVHARDRAEAKAASIGSVNPRPPGLLNDAVQRAKRMIARSMQWFVRDQVEFNRAAMDCVEALLGAISETNRAIAALVGHMDRRFEQLRQEFVTRAEACEGEARELKDVRLHWSEWRKEWEQKLSTNEVQFLRSVADLQTAFQHRVTLIEANLRQLTASQHRDFEIALDKARLDIQQRLWADLERTRLEFEKLIHRELRVMRQRVAAAPAAAAPAQATSAGIDFGGIPIDHLRFTDRFRGSEEYVKENQRRYIDHFSGCEVILDLGCGRGEFLDVLREAGKLARGVDSNAEMVALCRSKGLYAEQGDLFDYLGELDEACIDGIFSAQVVEHLPGHRIPEMLSLAAAALRPGGRIVIETPNPDCLAIFASHYFLDPTHQRPLPHALLAFYLEESGFGQITVEYLHHASDTMPSVDALPEPFRKAFLGGLDYAISARRL
jgi:O-antigen chain-terminating methyltransferase